MNSPNDRFQPAFPSPFQPALPSGRLALAGAAAPLRGADLPLLFSLDVLLEECNVTRAAARLHLSQPALSTQLSRLRSLFDDPLLVPAESGRGLVPSPFALRLHRRLQPALAVLSAAIRPELDAFDAAVAVRTFQVTANHTAAAMVLPQLAARMQALGNPNLRLVVAEPEDVRLPGRLEKGEVDLCLGAACLLPSGLHSEQLLTTPYVLIQRQGDPRGTAPVSIDVYCTLDHINIARDGSLHGFLDEHLYRLGHSRRTVMAVRDFDTAGAMVAASALVCAVPAALARTLHPRVECADIAFPAPVYTLCMAWHPARDEDPGLFWLRRQVQLAMASG